MNWQMLLDHGTRSLRDAGIEDADRKLRWWISDQLDCNLFSIPMRETVPPDLAGRYKKVVQRLCNHEPVQYVCGHAPFLDFDVMVSPDVLIPRPETEQLVQLALKNWIRPGDRVVDVGTGSGCIALAIKRAFPSCDVTGVDLSIEALRVASENADALNAEINFRQSNLLSAITDDSVDVIVANLPYVSDAEMEVLPNDVAQFEPASALRGGSDGADLLRGLMEDANRVCGDQGRILLETGEDHRQIIEGCAARNGWNLRSETDAADRERFWILFR